MATVTTQYPGNLAIQIDIWTLTLSEALDAIMTLAPHMGDYWYVNLTQPYRRALRKHADMVRIYTAGFSTGQLSNVLVATGTTIQRLHAD